jgi:hypothetical protein
VGGQPAGALDAVEAGAAVGEQVPRGVVDVHDHRVEEAPRLVGVEAGPVAHREEVAVHEAAPRVGDEHRTDRHEAPAVPVDDGLERVDDDQLADARVDEDLLGGVAQAETADRDVEVGAVQPREGEPRHLDLGHREQARHEELVTELHLEDVLAAGGVPPSAQAHLAEGRLAPAQLLEPPAQRPEPLTLPVSESPDGVMTQAIACLPARQSLSVGA